MMKEPTHMYLTTTGPASQIWQTAPRGVTCGALFGQPASVGINAEYGSDASVLERTPKGGPGA